MDGFLRIKIFEYENIHVTNGAGKKVYPWNMLSIVSMKRSSNLNNMVQPNKVFGWMFAKQKYKLW